MEEKKVCKACGVEKQVTQFPINLKMKSGRGNACKNCVAVGNRIKKPDTSSKTTQEKRARLNESTFKMSLVTKEDYLQMYEFIRLCGYDTDGDVHQQFLDKWNPQVKGKPMKKKKRNGNSINSYLPNGERNPLNKKYEYYLNKKDPTDIDEVFEL